MNPNYRFILPLKMHFVCLSASMFGFLSSAVVAQQKGDVTANLSASKVDLKDGKETLEPAGKAKPGDVIQYDAVYRNSSKASVRNVLATVPIPTHLEFIAESAKPAGALATADGKTFEPIPLMRTVHKPDGTTEKQPVPPQEYRALRWTINELAAVGSTKVSLRARVASTSTIK
jgi:uncharacterized repeat protein (TIGR01451 family)